MTTDPWKERLAELAGIVGAMLALAGFLAAFIVLVVGLARRAGLL